MAKVEKIMPEMVGRKRFALAVMGVTLMLILIGGIVTGVIVCRREARARHLAAVVTQIEPKARAETEARVAREKAEVERAEFLAQRPERLKTCKLVALTFDDGPSSETTERLLDILQEKMALATFFVIGNKAQNLPAIVQRELAEGHEVGGHTMGHLNFNKVKTASAVQSEMANYRAMYREVTGQELKIMRLPYGNGIRSGVVTANVGVPMIHWSVDTLDWKYKDAASVTARALEGVYDGAIILMHDIHPTTVEAVPRIIDELRAWGYEFVTISELAELRGVEMVAGQTYFYFKP